MQKLHSILHSFRIFSIFTWFTRIILAIAFLPSGFKKLMGMRFTSLGLDTPVGFFFEALYRSGIYWNFLGLMQLLAALLLIVPKTTTIGAILYLPIIINILVIVIGMHFIGTPVIAGLMLLANLYLLLWDYPKFQAIGKMLFSKS